MDAPVTRAELEETNASLKNQIDYLSRELHAIKMREYEIQPEASKIWRGTMGRDFSMDLVTSVSSMNLVSSMNTGGVIGPCSEGNITEMERVQTDNDKG